MRRSNVRTRWLAQKGCIATIASLPVVSDTSILIASSPVISRFSAWALNVTGTLAVSTPRPLCAGDTWYRAFEVLHAGTLVATPPPRRRPIATRARWHPLRSGDVPRPTVLRVMSHRLSSVAELTLAVPRSVCRVIPEARDWYGNALTSANASSINCRCRLDREKCSQPRAAPIRNRAGTVCGRWLLANRLAPIVQARTRQACLRARRNCVVFVW